MNKDLIWKIGIILIIVVVAALLVWPPQHKLKLGLDLAGGTSLIYEISTDQLTPGETAGIAERMIPILRRRIDPTNVANIVMRPQGDTRIEIQLPITSEETKQKRKIYEQTLEDLEKQNINLSIVKRYLDEEPEVRKQKFEEFANGVEKRKKILDELASAYDERTKAQQKRDELQEKKMQLLEKLLSIGLDAEQIKTRTANWKSLKKENRMELISSFVEQYEPNEKGLLEKLTSFGKPKAADLLNDYVEAQIKWAEQVNKLADPDTGLNVRYKNAAAQLMRLNLTADQVSDILELPPESALRTQKIEQLKQNFPDRQEQIALAVAAYDEYRQVSGRLDDPQDLKRMLKGAGVLEFRILPTTNDGVSNMSEIQAYIEDLQARGPKMTPGTKYKWFEIEDINNFPTSFQESGIGQPIIQMFGDTPYVLASNQPEEAMIHSDDEEWKLKRAYPTTDGESGLRVPGFDFDTTGAKKFYNLTRLNTKRPLCILLDDIAISAPFIPRAIDSTGVIIKGTFTDVEIDNMVNKLNAGSFKARLSEVPISEKSIGPVLGKDNRNKGILAGLIGLAAVGIFMLLYYLLPGFVADLALLMNIIFVLAMMVILNATFTLPGIAGIILTIGMSVDANVLIFERIREEQLRGSSLRTAIANGYEKAFRTIFDANVTTFITALILYMVASEEIKGFAIVLMLGIASSMFTALFVTRVIFEFFLDRRIIRDHLVMLRIIKKPNIKWMALRPLFFIISAVLIIGGFTAFFSRNEKTNSKYDIEFTGGTSVTIDFKQNVDINRAEVERAIHLKGAQINNEALQAARVYSVGQTGKQFEINTIATNKTYAAITPDGADMNTEKVKQLINDTASTIGRKLYNLEVTPAEQEGSFIVSIGQVNKTLLTNVLEKALGQDTQISEPQVDEIVNDAVKEAFEGKLAVRENLGPKIQYVEKVSETAVEIADFIGGYQILCQLDTPVKASELKARFSDLRFKPDTRDLSWFRYKIVSTDLQPLKENEMIDSFVFLTVHPEAGYRELSQDETELFLKNEENKVLQACKLETTLTRVTQIDPSIGAQARNKAAVAILLSLIAIVGYIWIRFGTARYGFAAIAALVHDVCITIGAVTVCTYIAGTPMGRALGIGDFKINLEMIAAFLTIIGYSLNDTIVIFDRIRENRSKMANLTPSVISDSVNQTLSRTLLTSFTTFLVVLIMYIWGGPGLRGFTFALLIGIIVGTYSSIAIASPILILGKKSK